MRRRRRGNRRNYVTIRTSYAVLMFRQALLIGSLVACAIMGIVTYTTKQQNYIMRDALARLDDSFKTKSLANLDDRIDQFNRKQEAREVQYQLIQDNADEVLLRNVKLNRDVNGLLKDMVALDEQNAALIAQAQKYKDDWYELAKRKELYDKYKYAIIDPDTGRRTDITYDDIILTEDLANRYGYDANYLLSTCMVESRGIEDAYNPSGASGVAQLMPSTAKATYEKYMGKGAGSFRNEMLFNSEYNISIAAAYIDKLINQNDNIYGVIDGYAGGHDESYYRKLMRWLSYSGKSLDDINQEIYG